MTKVSKFVDQTTKVEFRKKAPIKIAALAPEKDACDMAEILAHGYAGKRKTVGLKTQSNTWSVFGATSHLNLWSVTRKDFIPKDPAARRKLAVRPHDTDLFLPGLISSDTAYRSQFRPLEWMVKRRNFEKIQWKAKIACIGDNIEVKKPIRVEDRSEARDAWVALNQKPAKLIRPPPPKIFPVEPVKTTTTYRDLFKPLQKPKRPMLRFVFPRDPIVDREKALKTAPGKSVYRLEYGAKQKSAGCDACGVRCNLTHNYARKKYEYVPTPAPLESKTVYRIEYKAKPYIIKKYWREQPGEGSSSIEGLESDEDEGALLCGGDDVGADGKRSCCGAVEETRPDAKGVKKNCRRSEKTGRVNPK